MLFSLAAGAGDRGSPNLSRSLLKSKFSVHWETSKRAGLNIQ